MPEIDRPDDPRELADVLFRAWQTPGDPCLSTGSFELSGCGYVQLTRIDEADSALHLEINEGLACAEPLPAGLVGALVAFGWDEPTEQFRNCWLHASPAQQEGFRDTAQRPQRRRIGRAVAARAGRTPAGGQRRAPAPHAVSGRNKPCTGTAAPSA